jgi:hypothetical protein
MHTQFKSFRWFAAMALVITTQSCLLSEDTITPTTDPLSSSSANHQSVSSAALVPNQNFLITGTVLEAGTTTPVSNLNIIVAIWERNDLDNVKLQKSTVSCMPVEPQGNVNLAKNSVACITPPKIIGTFVTDKSGAFSATVPNDGIYDLTIDQMIDDIYYGYQGTIQVTNGKSDPLTIEIVPSGLLTPICYELWAPVCGSDGVTYSNDCYASQAGITSFTQGSCSNPNPTCETVNCEQGFHCAEVMEGCLALTPECLNPRVQCIPDSVPIEPPVDTTWACNMMYAPGCGVDGVTYGNSCMARGAEIAYEGECPYH